MMKNIREFYLKLTEKKFRLIAAGSCLWGDLVLSKFLYDKFTDQTAFDANYEQSKVILDKVYSQQGIELPADFKVQVFQLLVNSLMTMLALFMLFHIFNYTFFIFRKKFAQYYLTFLSWSGTVGALLMTISVTTSNFGWASLFFLQMLLFLSVAYGLKIYPIVTTPAATK